VSVKKLMQRYRYSAILLRELVVTDFKLRYQGSFLGYLWSLLRPLGLFVILYLVFVRFLRIGGDIPNYPIYLLLGIVIWNYFAEVTNGGVRSIVDRGDLIRKLNFPKYVIVLAGSFSALINLFINLLVVSLFMFLKHVDMHWHAVLFPLVIAELFLFALSAAFLLSAIFVKLRDINYVWEVLMQGLFYATPIIYPINLLPATVAKIFILNPIAQCAQDLRYLLVTPDTKTIGTIYGTEWARLIPVGIVLVITVVSFWFFKKHSPRFAEEV